MLDGVGAEDNGGFMDWDFDQPMVLDDVVELLDAQILEAIYINGVLNAALKLSLESLGFGLIDLVEEAEWVASPE